MIRLVIIGGSDAGISAALRARELDPTTDVTVLVADQYPNFSICGLPFYLSGEITNWHTLAHRTVDEIRATGMHLFLNHRAIAIDPMTHQVTARDAEGALHQFAYDRLLIGTGALPTRPSIVGLDLPGVHCLHSMDDCFAFEQSLAATSQPPRSAVIIGAGYIGLEMADALRKRGLEVTLIEHNPAVLKTVDVPLGQRIEEELHRHGVQVITPASVEEIVVSGTRLRVRGTPDVSLETDVVLVSVGVRPEVELAQTAGVTIGSYGAIRVNRAMETNVPAIYAAGDCVETWHRLLQEYTYLPLGTTAHKQGRVAGENAIGGQQLFAGSLGTQVLKVFDLVIARTGLRENEAREAGFDPLTVETTHWDHKVYYPGAQPLHIRLTGDKTTGSLLGAQMIGHARSEVSKRIDIFATALFHAMSVDALSNLDLSYTPPLSSPWDPVQMSAQSWEKERRSLLISSQVS